MIRRMSPRVMAVKLMMITTNMMMMVSPGRPVQKQLQKETNIIRIMEFPGDDLYRPRI